MERLVRLGFRLLVYLPSAGRSPQRAFTPGTPRRVLWGRRVKDAAADQWLIASSLDSAIVQPHHTYRACDASRYILSRLVASLACCFPLRLSVPGRPVVLEVDCPQPLLPLGAIPSPPKRRTVPPQASPIQDLPGQGVSHSIWPAPTPICTGGRTSPFLYICSTLSHIEQVVKCFGTSPSRFRRSRGLEGRSS